MPRDFLNDNLTSLKRRNPWLAEKLSSLNPSGGVESVASGTGEPTVIRVASDGAKKRIHSRRDPRGEAAKWAQNQSIKPSRTVALMGLGLGYPADEILKIHKDRLGGLWCFESSVEIFREMLAWKDWRWLIEEPRVQLFVGSTEEEFRAQAAGLFQKVVIDGIDILEFPSCVQSNPEWYRAHAANIRNLLMQWSAEMRLVMGRGRLFLANILTNFNNLRNGRSYLLRDLGERFADRPAILVSAGPSLDKNGGMLRDAKGKIPIVAVDTALRILARHEVVPDLVVSIDSLGISKKHFEGVENLADIPLVYDLEVAPEVLTNYPGPRFLLGNTKPRFYSWLEEAIGPLEGLTKSLTVAQAAFQILAHYGARPIILVGQDLSFEREGGKTHAEGAAFQGRFEPAGEGKGRWEDPLDPKGMLEVPVLWVPGNDGEPVPTNYTLFTYLKRFEDDIARTRAEVLNATAGGAAIRGTKPLPLEEVLKTYSGAATASNSGASADSKDFLAFCHLDRRERSESVNAKIPPSGRNDSVVEGGLSDIRDRYGAHIEAMGETIVSTLEEAKEKCTEGFALCDKLWRDLGWKNLDKNELAQRTRAVNDIYNRLVANPELLMLIDQGVQTSLYMLHKGDLPPHAERTAEDHRKIVDRYRTLFADALEVIEQNLGIMGSGY
jgi:hypothetical protein